MKRLDVHRGGGLGSAFGKIRMRHVAFTIDKREFFTHSLSAFPACIVAAATSQMTLRGEFID